MSTTANQPALEEEARKNRKSTTFLVLAGGAGVAILIALATYFTTRFGAASQETSLAYKAGNFLVGFACVSVGMIFLVKWGFPNTLGRDLGHTFNRIWNDTLPETHKFWAMLVTVLVFFYGLIQLFAAS